MAIENVALHQQFIPEYNHTCHSFWTRCSKTLESSRTLQIKHFFFISKIGRKVEFIKSVDCFCKWCNLSWNKSFYRIISPVFQFNRIFKAITMAYISFQWASIPKSLWHSCTMLKSNVFCYLTSILIVIRCGAEDVWNHPNWPNNITEICGETNGDRIIGGRTASLGQYPWMTRLVFRRLGELSNIHAISSLDDPNFNYRQ